MKDATELSLVDELPEEDDRRHPAVVVPDGIGHARLLDRSHHALRFCRGSRQRLLAHHHFSGLGGRNGNPGMCVVGARDVDEIDVGSINDCAPVRFCLLVAPVRREGLDAILLPGGYRLQHRLIRQVEIPRSLS